MQRRRHRVSINLAVTLGVSAGFAFLLGLGMAAGVLSAAESVMIALGLTVLLGPPAILLGGKH